MKKGWETKKLGEVCEFEGGSQPPKSQFIYEPKFGYVRFLQIRDFASDKHITFIPESKKNRLCSEVDIMIGRYGASVGKILTGKAGAYNVALMKAIPKLGIMQREWFHSYLLSDEFQDRLMNVAARSAQDGFSREDISNFPVPIPPLTEQQRIVGVLDEAFAGLTTAQANAAQNLQNARALFESHLQSIFNQRGNGWVEKPVKGIAAPFKGSIRTGPFGSQLLHSEFVAAGIPVLGIDNAVANEFQWGKSRFITLEKYRQLERYTVRPGDVLITIMGTCGRCAIVPDDMPTAINTKHICCITLDHGQCLPSYLHTYFLHAPQSRAYLAKHAKGAIMAGLNMGLIQQLPVMLPPISVQQEIIDGTKALSAETQRLSRLYKQKQEALAALKKSLLHQAFTGEL